MMINALTQEENMTITGTSHFVSRQAAYKYYEPYGYAIYDVDEKVHAKEIHIGKPALKPGQRLVVIDEGTRYAIEEA
jgi:hypothetical protein